MTKKTELLDISNFVMSDEALNLIDEGTWVGGLPGAPGVKLKVTGLYRSPEAQEKLNDIKAVMRVNNEGEPLSADQEAEALQKVLADVVLKDWDGLASEGEPLPYSKDMARQFLTSRNGERFALLVLEAARRLDANANAYVEKVAKN